MTDEEEGLPELHPTWWLSTFTELWLRVWKIIGEDAVTDEDRRDARWDARKRDD
jgi:hypothetical protein